MQSNAHLLKKVSIVPLYTHNAEWLNSRNSHYMYRYLGLLISSDLSCSNHIQSVCTKARKILTYIYRKYYRFSNTATLLQLYTSLVRPHLDYAASIWDPHLQCDIQLLEGVQKFACRMCNKAWKTGYEELLSTLQL